MIEAYTKNEDDGVRIEVSGHAVDDFGDRERDQVCSAVSTLLVTLVTLTNGVWNGEGSGYATCVVPKQHLRLAEYVVVGLQMLQGSYSEHIKLERRDTRLFSSPETGKWNRITQPK